jgi:hypothetical protein
MFDLTVLKFEPGIFFTKTSRVITDIQSCLAEYIIDAIKLSHP